MLVRRLLLLLALLMASLLGTASGGDARKQQKADEAKLFEAKIAIDGPGLLEFFKQRTLTDAERVKYQAIIKNLGAKAFKEREQASGVLIARGPVMMNLLKEGLESDDVEIVRRCEKIIARLREKELPTEVPLAAARLLAERKPAGAVEVLLAYLPFADNDAISDEARNTLAAIALNDGKADPLLVAALTDKDVLRRAAAGEALARAETAEHKASVKKLLADPEPLVRFRVASGLAHAKDRDAIPVLIDLLSQLPPPRIFDLEELLFRLAGTTNPPQVALGSSEAERKKAREVWAAWWKDQGPKIDLARLRETPKLLNFTLLVLLDMGQILEVDSGDDNKVRWKIQGLQKPLDVQLLPNDRVLVAEYDMNRVSEWDTKSGEMKSSYRFLAPLAAQRLPNGNTFIASDHEMVELDIKENEVFRHTMLNGDKIMKVAKQPNGQVIFLSDSGRVIRLDEKGKEISSFGIGLGTRLFGGRIYALPSGRVLIAHHGENKVVEYDTSGKAVWEVSVEQPVAAIRLPNGNTLVTTMGIDPGRAIEFDRAGREVWDFKNTNSRVTRALRR